MLFRRGGEDALHKMPKSRAEVLRTTLGREICVPQETTCAGVWEPSGSGVSDGVSKVAGLIANTQNPSANQVWPQAGDDTGKTRRESLQRLGAKLSSW